MNFDKSFKRQPTLIQIILLIIPGVNWITEILVRASVYNKHRGALNMFCLILVLLTGFVLGYIDLISQLISGHFIFER